MSVHTGPWQYTKARDRSLSYPDVSSPPLANTGRKFLDKQHRLGTTQQISYLILSLALEYKTSSYLPDSWRDNVRKWSLALQCTRHQQPSQPSRGVTAVSLSPVYKSPLLCEIPRGPLQTCWQACSLFKNLAQQAYPCPSEKATWVEQIITHYGILVL